MKRQLRNTSIALLACCLAMAGCDSKTAGTNDGKQAAAPEQNKPLYAVVDGTKVDPKTLEGWKTWRAMACERCHGAKQEGGIGPALVDSLKKLSKEDFKTTVTNGRPGTPMPSFASSKQVTDNLDNLYAYLKGRSDGKIEPGHLSAIGQ
jgi:mono/diheme cytochrome c family protein